MNKLLVDCSISPVGQRGFLVPATRKNPRFKAGTVFTIKSSIQNSLLIKFRDCNSIFAISDKDAKIILGKELIDYNEDIKAKKVEGMRALAAAYKDIFKKENGWDLIE